MVFNSEISEIEIIKFDYLSKFDQIISYAIPNNYY